MIKYFISYIFVLILFNGCSNKMIIEPIIKENLNSEKQIKANFIGKKTFLPKNILEDKNSLVYVDYSIVEKYNISGKDTDVLNIFNPLLLVGFPLGDNLFLVNSKLKIIKNKMILKEYSASCLHTYTRNLFDNPDFTEMRQKCLKEIENNLNSQIIIHIKKGELNEVLY